MTNCAFVGRKLNLSESLNVCGSQHMENSFIFSECVNLSLIFPYGGMWWDRWGTRTLESLAYDMVDA